ncbi:glycosyltransferase family 2 protein [Paenibacillus flagellatus]|uniref:Glycosyltransferase family 2 protein n=2 Tax=Paenibacillus flagellatus TaxID=2211139 RepID=A0A2V5K1X4_9BACL|nr:glycosyltransferase family 2 protein [Paenibacillus flagellatus]
MNRRPAIVIGLPVYNEEAALPKLLDRLEALRDKLGEPPRVVFVDDGSTDRTAAIVERFSATYPCAVRIAHPTNRGLGAAMQTMLAYVVRHYGDADVLVTLDADNTHNPALIPAMVDKLRDERLELVIASRFAPGGRELGLSLRRKLYSRGARLFFKLLFPIPRITDYSSGFRAYSVALLRRAYREYDGALVTTGGFACTAEIAARLAKIGVKAGECPLVLEYHLKEGRSKMNVRRTVAGYFRLLRAVKAPSAPAETERPAGLLERQGESGA